MQRLRALHRLHIEIGNIALAVWQLHTDLELGIEHHVIFPKAASPIVHAQNALLHLHLVGRAPPGYRVVFALLAPGTCDSDAAFGEGETRSRTLGGRLGDLVGGAVWGGTTG